VRSEPNGKQPVATPLKSRRGLSCIEASLYGHAVDWSVLIAAVVGALAAILGGALTPLVTARRAHRDWRRDKLAEASEQLSAAVLEVMFKLNDDRYMPPSRDMEDLDFKRLTQAVGMVGLYGSQELGSAAFDVMDAYEGLRLSVGEGLKRQDELVREMANRGRAVTVFTRRDLKLKHRISGRTRSHGPVEVLAQPALDRRVAEATEVRSRVSMIRNATRVLFGITTVLFLIKILQQRRPRST